MLIHLLSSTFSGGSIHASYLCILFMAQEHISTAERESYSAARPTVKGYPQVKQETLAPFVVLIALVVDGSNVSLL